MRTDLSRASGEYLIVVFTTPSSQSMKSPVKSGDSLTAKYGLVDPDTKLKPYEFTLNSAKKRVGRNSAGDLP